MNITVKQVIDSEEKTSKAGKPYTVTTFLGDDGEVYKNVFGKFEAGQVVTGDWVDSDYGRQFKVSMPPKAGFKKDDPQTQKQIIRQNSLTNAVNYVLGKAAHMEKKEALDFISGKEVIQVATYFAKYSEGTETVVTANASPQADVVKAKVEQANWSKEEEALDLSGIEF